VFLHTVKALRRPRLGNTQLTDEVASVATMLKRWGGGGGG
jgi:hypothetical protein